MFFYHHLYLQNESQWNGMERNGKTDRHQKNKFNVQVCFSIIILISKMNLNGTERNGKTDRHQRKKFNVHVCFSIIILISKMNLNGMERNGTEKLIDIRGIISMFKCVSLSSWSTKWISTEWNGTERNRKKWWMCMLGDQEYSVSLFQNY